MIPVYKERADLSKYAAKVTSKGQVTIPKPVRDELGLEEGDYLVLEPKGQYVVGTKALLAPTDDFGDLAERIAGRFRKKGISRAEVEDAIRWARQES
jgi:antitoxin PrlF